MAIKIRSGNQWVPVSGGGGEPIGTITVWSGASSNIPDGYRLCDGSFLSRTDYSALFSAIGTTNGAGDGSSTFNIPDLRDKFIVGASDSTGDTTYPGVSPAATGGSADAIVVSHRHTTDNYVGRASYAEPRNFGVGTDGNLNSTGTTGDAQDFSTDKNTIGESGTNKNLPPYYALCYIIKVFNTKITITGSGGGVIVQNEGSALATTATTLNFVGDNVVASGTGATKTITISSSSGSNVTNSLNITGDEGSDATLNLTADQGDDNGDKWRIRSDATGNDLKFETYTSGSWSDGTPLRMQSNGNTYLTGQLIVDKVNINGNVIQLNSGTEDLKVRGNGTGGTYHLNLDDDVSITGNLNIGDTTTTLYDTNTALQVNGTNAGPNLVLHRNDTSVSTNQVLGALRITGNDSNGTQQESSAIEFQADLNHGTDDKPGRIVFKTTNDGASSATEKLRIGSAGQIGLSGENYGTATQVLTSNGPNSAPTWETPSSAPSIPTKLPAKSAFAHNYTDTNYQGTSYYNGNYANHLTASLTPSNSDNRVLVVASFQIKRGGGQSNNWYAIARLSGGGDLRQIETVRTNSISYTDFNSFKLIAYDAAGNTSTRTYYLQVSYSASSHSSASVSIRNASIVATELSS